VDEVVVVVKTSVHVLHVVSGRGAGRTVMRKMIVTAVVLAVLAVLAVAKMAKLAKPGSIGSVPQPALGPGGTPLSFPKPANWGTPRPVPTPTAVPGSDWDD